MRTVHALLACILLRSSADESLCQFEMRLDGEAAKVDLLADRRDTAAVARALVDTLGITDATLGVGCDALPGQHHRACVLGRVARAIDSERARCAEELARRPRYVFVHPGKTGGTSIRGAGRNIDVLLHDQFAPSSAAAAACFRERACTVAQVLRDPLDRFESAMRFKRDPPSPADVFHGAHLCVHYLKAHADSAAVRDPRFQSLCVNTSSWPVFAPQAAWSGEREREMLFLCFGELEAEWRAKVACVGDCALPHERASVKPDGHETHAAVREYVARTYARDAALYERHCARRAQEREADG